MRLVYNGNGYVHTYVDGSNIAVANSNPARSCLEIRIRVRYSYATSKLLGLGRGTNPLYICYAQLKARGATVDDV